MIRRRTAHDNIWHFGCFQRTQQALAKAHALVGQPQPLAVITGDAGSGKSFSAEHYASGRSDVALAVCPPTHLATPLALLLAVAEAVGMVDRPRRVATAYESLRRVLEGRPRLVILDEADQVRSARDLDVLRYLADETDTAFCFLGCPSLETVVKAKAPLARRVGYRYPIGPATDVEVKRVLAKYYTEEIAVAIYRQSGGNIGYLERILRFLADPELQGKPITPELIAAGAEKYLMVGVAA